MLLKNVFADVSDNRFRENHCAVINSKLKYGWQSYLCESGLPFVCKKYLNETEHEILGKSQCYYILFVGVEGEQEEVTCI